MTAPILPLAGAMSVLIGQRLTELLISAHHTPQLVQRGAVERGRETFPALVVVHVLLLVALPVEVLFLGARPGVAWPVWVTLWFLAQALRVSAMRELGTRWHVRIWVIPGAPPVRTGPYRYLSHPNYLAVVVELIAAPMVLGAWRTALLVSTLNAVALPFRIRAESRALRDAAAEAATREPERGEAVRTVGARESAPIVDAGRRD